MTKTVRWLLSQCAIEDEYPVTDGRNKGIAYVTRDLDPSLRARLNRCKGVIVSDGHLRCAPEIKSTRIIVLSRGV